MFLHSVGVLFFHSISMASKHRSISQSPRGKNKNTAEEEAVDVEGSFTSPTPKLYVYNSPICWLIEPSSVF